jgi:hypothetical protein
VGSGTDKEAPIVSSKPRKGVWLAASAIVLAISVAPFALAAGENTPVKGGARNPSSNAALSYTRETQIIANTSTYGTRQSNKSDNGGGAIYGCRSGAGGSAQGNEPCIRAVDLALGYAFEFETRGTQGGLITVGNGGDSVKPFTTNATGVADGLNADRVDGKNASDIVTDAQAQNQFAKVAADGSLSSARGASSSSRSQAGTYTVTFASDVSKCAYQATEIGDRGENTGATSVNTVPNQLTQLSVITRDGGGADGTGPTGFADHPFHLVVIC